MTIAVFDIDHTTITYDKTKLNGSAQAGLEVTLVAPNKVGLVSSPQSARGRLLRVEFDCKAHCEWYSDDYRFVEHDGTRLHSLSRFEREVLRSIAQRHAAITRGEQSSNFARLHQDVGLLLSFIGGEFAELAERS